MLRRDRQLRTQIGQLKDSALFALSLWLAHVWRAHFPDTILWWTFEPIFEFKSYAWLYLIIIPGVPLILEAQGFYQRPLFGPRRETAWLLFKSCFFVAVGVIIFLYLFRFTDLARGVIVLFAAISFVLVFATEELMRGFYRSRMGEMQMRKRMLLVGAPEDRARLREEFHAKGIDHLDIVGELDLNLTTIPGLVKLLHDTSANGVIINARHTYFGLVEQTIQACEIEGVEAWLVADFFKTQVSNTSLDDFYGRPVLVFRSAPEASWQGVCKHVMDRVLAFCLVVLCLPVWILVPLAIRLSSPGPILFRQRRCGLNGLPFTMLKFRSMVTDAEQRQQELAALNEMGGPVFKLTNDPRVTRVGRFLRKYSLDEFPQLFNVLRGEMSLVGPRPLPVDEVERFDDPADRRRLSVRPGLTCLWQISGRNNVRDFKDWVRLDLEYIDNWSLWLDLKILWRTVPVVLAGTGAK
jgi:exopolysaccharide biosynthesis polyprenyl glycosylphosphotransferase